MHPFDIKTVVFAKHAQHVVLIHFPIALFISAVIFDLIAQWTDRRGLADAAYLQPVGRNDFNVASSRHGNSRLAIST